jgi:hypothetical protein
MWEDVCEVVLNQNMVVLDSVSTRDNCNSLRIGKGAKSRTAVS